MSNNITHMRKLKKLHKQIKMDHNIFLSYLLYKLINNICNL